MSLESQKSLPFAASEAWLGALERTARIAREPHRTLPVVVEDFATRYGSRLALIGESEVLTYAELASRLRRYARWADSQGLGRGDVVCLLMENRPEYLAVWLGLTVMGVTVALLNTNLVGAALAHCIDTARPVYIIVSAKLIESWESARPYLAASASPMAARIR